MLRRTWLSLMVLPFRKPQQFRSARSADPRRFSSKCRWYRCPPAAGTAVRLTNRRGWQPDAVRHMPSPDFHDRCFLPSTASAKRVGMRAGPPHDHVSARIPRFFNDFTAVALVYARTQNVVCRSHDRSQVLKRCPEIGSPGFCVRMISITCATKIAFRDDLLTRLESILPNSS
jgi:hypothetical protein